MWGAWWRCCFGACPGLNWILSRVFTLCHSFGYLSRNDALVGFFLNTLVGSAGVWRTLVGGRDVFQILISGTVGIFLVCGVIVLKMAVNCHSATVYFSPRCVISIVEMGLKRVSFRSDYSCFTVYYGRVWGVLLSPLINLLCQRCSLLLSCVCIVLCINNVAFQYVCTILPGKEVPRCPY